MGLQSLVNLGLRFIQFLSVSFCGISSSYKGTSQVGLGLTRLPHLNLTTPVNTLFPKKAIFIDSCLGLGVPF